MAECLICKESYERKRPLQKYCSVECKRRGQYLINRERRERLGLPVMQMKGKCKECEREYEPKNSAQKYCSDTCRLVAEVRMQRKYRSYKKAPPKTCEVCGKEYEVKGGGSLTCGRVCSKARSKRIYEEKRDAQRKAKLEKEQRKRERVIKEAGGVQGETSFSAEVEAFLRKGGTVKVLPGMGEVNYLGEVEELLGEEWY